LNGSNGLIYTSSDYGVSWTARLQFISGDWRGISISETGQYQTAVSYSGNSSAFSVSAGTYIHTSSDYGVTWIQRKQYSYNWTGISISSTGQYQSACNVNNYVYTSSDYGVFWTPRTFASGDWRSISVSSSGKYQSVCMYNNYVYTSYDYGVNWTSRSFSSNGWQCISVSGNGKYQTVVGNGVSPWYSLNYGVDWYSAGQSGWNWTTVALAASGRFQIATNTSWNQLWFSNNYGQSWSYMDSGAVFSVCYSIGISSSGQYIIAGHTSGYDLYISSNFGRTFSNVQYDSRSLGITYGKDVSGIGLWVVTGGRRNRDTLESAANTMAYSYDGKLWCGLLASKCMSHQAWSVAYGKDGLGAGMWVAGGYDTICGLKWSYDGINWNATLGSGAHGWASFASGRRVTSVYWNGSMWYASTSATSNGELADFNNAASGLVGYLLYSYNGKNWLPVLSNTNNAFNNINTKNIYSSLPNSCILDFGSFYDDQAQRGTTISNTVAGTVGPTYSNIPPKNVNTIVPYGRGSRITGNTPFLMGGDSGLVDITSFISISTPLYAFTSHTFTTAGQTGRQGPLLTTVRSAYTSANAPWATTYLNMTTRGIQEWTVPETGSYNIRAVGAAGGNPGTFGRGRDIQLITTLTKGEVIKILVGQQGTSTNSIPGGGGGSFVVRGTQTAIIVAGGGGGRASSGNEYVNSNASLNNSGNKGGDGSGSNNGDGGINGEGGAGGYASEGMGTGGAGGGGLIGNGGQLIQGNGVLYGKGGLSFISGGLGAEIGGSGSDADGGFGGGGSSTNGGGAGGGGYSGGGGGSGLNNGFYSGGGGGGSFPFTATDAGATNTGNGFITITFMPLMTTTATSTYTIPITSEIATTAPSLSTSTDGGISWRAVPNSTNIMTKVNKIMCDESTQQIVAVGTGNYSIATSTPATCDLSNGWSGVFGSRMINTKSGLFDHYGTGASWFSGAKMWIGSGRSKNRNSSTLAVSVNGTVWQDAKIVSRKNTTTINKPAATITNIPIISQWINYTKTPAYSPLLTSNYVTNASITASLINTNNYTQIQSLLGLTNMSQLKLQYKGTIDGMTANAFHSKVANIAPLFIVIKNTAGYIATAYSTIAFSDTTNGSTGFLWRYAAAGTCWVNNFYNPIGAGTYSTTKYTNQTDLANTLQDHKDYGLWLGPSPTIGFGPISGPTVPFTTILSNGAGPYTGATGTILFGANTTTLLDFECYSIEAVDLSFKSEYSLPANKTSMLINSSNISFIKQLLTDSSNNDTPQLKLIWKSTVSSDGWDSSTWHTRVNGISPLLVVIKNTAGYIATGYTSIAYTTSGYGQNASASTTQLPEFSNWLNPFYNPTTNTYSTVKYGNLANSDYATYDINSHGPTFGAGHDLYMPATMNNSVSSGASTYTRRFPPTAPSFTSSTLFGTSSSTPVEMECYMIAIPNTVTVGRYGTPNFFPLSRPIFSSGDNINTPLNAFRLMASTNVNSASGSAGALITDLSQLRLIYKLTSETLKTTTNWHYIVRDVSNLLIVVRAANGYVFTMFTGPIKYGQGNNQNLSATSDNQVFLNPFRDANNNFSTGKYLLIINGGANFTLDKDDTGPNVFIPVGTSSNVIRLDSGTVANSFIPLGIRNISGSGSYYMNGTSLTNTTLIGTTTETEIAELECYSFTGTRTPSFDSISSTYSSLYSQFNSLSTTITASTTPNTSSTVVNQYDSVTVGSVNASASAAATLQSATLSSANTEALNNAAVRSVTAINDDALATTVTEINGGNASPWVNLSKSASYSTLSSGSVVANVGTTASLINAVNFPYIQNLRF
jgi:hypothetical protein